MSIVTLCVEKKLNTTVLVGINCVIPQNTNLI